MRDAGRPELPRDAELLAVDHGELKELDARVAAVVELRLFAWAWLLPRLS